MIGKVISAEAHPNSDHLNVVRVHLGTALGERQIVCGAPNVREATYVPVAMVGAKMSEDFTIGKAKLR